MNAISDSVSTASLARSFEASQQMDLSATDLGGAYEDGGTIGDFPKDLGEPLDLGAKNIIGDERSWPEDREIYVNDEGQLGWRTVVKGTSGDDTIDVALNADGSADVTVNGETTHYTPEEAKDMRISGGAGDDTITVTDNRWRLCGMENGDVTIEGGSGDDSISGDLGRVDADGGTGSDTINGIPELDFPHSPIDLPRIPR